MTMRVEPDMVRAAISGRSHNPSQAYRAPAAMGRARALADRPAEVLVLLADGRAPDAVSIATSVPGADGDSRRAE
ncbi:MAG: hypothetical protein BGO37_13825 [Cellulomonas sp. 73-92]|nr:MAG: hypothetical protein BGO37_13825 [Cellulomonas sp. 73-92]